jgi:3',5'-cyclic AMP phosphodiesterase CpdA
MRILVTADLHYRPSQRDIYLAFARWVEAQEPDCFIISGDVGHPLRLYRRALQLFTGLSCPRLLIAGNHDLYRGEHDSRALWETVLPGTARDEGFVWLEDTVVTLPLALRDGVGTGRDESPKIGICGTLAWYDYSSRHPDLGYTDDDYRHLKGIVNHDADYIDWPWSDVAMARFLTRRFDERLLSLEQDPGVHQILVVTHMPVFEQAVAHHVESSTWRLLSAYMGNLTLGELLRGSSKVTHVVSGHIHHPGRWTVAGRHGPIDFRLVGSQKGAPAAVILDFSAPEIPGSDSDV